MKTVLVALCFIALSLPSSNAVDLTTWHKASNNYYYKVFENKLNYAAAQKACADMGARLATAGIRDAGVRSEWIKAFDRNKGRNIWFGLNDLAKQFEWMYLDGKNGCNTDEFWHAHEPNNHNNNNERCAHMWYRDNEWSANDAPCSVANGYVCEYMC